jgi:hypothetical protein
MSKGNNACNWRRTALAAKERHDRRVHLDRALAFFDVLLAGAAVVVERNETLHRPRQVGDDKADARIKLTWMLLDLGHHSSGLCP